MKYFLTSDVFCLPYNEDKYIFYAPLEQFACICNIEFLQFIDNIKKHIDIPFEKNQNIITYLLDKGIISNQKDTNQQFANKTNCQFCKQSIFPTKLTLFPTNRCNMACGYCYAKTYRNHEIMSLKTAKMAIDYFKDHLIKNEQINFPLEFHGGGEPFYDFELIKQIVYYAEETCLKEKINLEIFAGTNGLFNNLQIKWITDHFEALNISFDGLPRIQNIHRPLPQKRESFEILDNTLKQLDSYNFPYSIRCSVSTYNENLLEETVHFITSQYKPRMIYLGPVYYYFEDDKPEISSPDLEKFATKFIELESIYAKKKVSLIYSGACAERLTKNFCYVGTDNFAVTPDGHLTNCWQVNSINHPLASKFIFGRFNEKGEIKINQRILNYLKNFSVDQIEYCKNCFAKWHCAGNCIIKIDNNNFDNSRKSQHCDINRYLVKHQILNMLERSDFYEKTDIVQNYQ